MIRQKTIAPASTVKMMIKVFMIMLSWSYAEVACAALTQP